MGKRFIRTWSTNNDWHRLCLEHITFVNEQVAQDGEAAVCLHFVSGDTLTILKERYEQDILPRIEALSESTEHLVAIDQSLEALVSFARALDERDTHRFATGK